MPLNPISMCVEPPTAPLGTGITIRNTTTIGISNNRVRADGLTAIAGIRGLSTAEAEQTQSGPLLCPLFFAGCYVFRVFRRRDFRTAARVAWGRPRVPRSRRQRPRGGPGRSVSPPAAPRSAAGGMGGQGQARPPPRHAAAAPALRTPDCRAQRTTRLFVYSPAPQLPARSASARLSGAGRSRCGGRGAFTRRWSVAGGGRPPRLTSLDFIHRNWPGTPPIGRMRKGKAAQS